MSTDTLADERVRAAVPSGIGAAVVAAAAVGLASRSIPALGQLLAMALTMIGGYGTISTVSGVDVKTEIDPECGCPRRSGIDVPMTRDRAILAGICGGVCLVGLTASIVFFGPF